MVSINRLLNKKMLRELKNNYKQYISVILIAVLVVALFTGLSANYYHFSENVEAIYNDSNIADLFVTTKAYEEDDREYIASLVGTENINERFYFQTVLKDNRVTISVNDENNIISVPASIKGIMGVLLDETFASNHHIKIGDSISFDLPLDYQEILSNDQFRMLSPFFNNSLKDGKDNFFSNKKMKLEFKVSGTMTHAEAIANSSFSGGLVYISNQIFKEALANCFDDNYNTNLVIQEVKKQTIEYNFTNQYIIKGGEAIKGKIDDYFYAKENNNLLISLTRQNLPSNQAIESDVINAKQLLFVFPIVFYVVGLLVIITSLSQLINKDRQSIGILSSLGVAKNKLIMHYAKFSIMLTTIGGIIGLIVGPLIIPKVMMQKYSILYQLQEVKHPIFYLSYLLCFLFLIVACVVITLILSNKVLSTNPSMIMRNTNSKGFKGLLIEKLRIFEKTGLCIRMAIRNMCINLARSIMVIVGVCGCTALLLCGFGIDNTLNYGINKEVNEMINYDISLMYEDNKTISYAGIDNIKLIEEYYETTLMVKSNEKTLDTSILLLEEDFQIFKAPYTSGKCAVTSKIAADLGVKAGDSITYFYNNQNYEIEVSAVIELCFTQGIIMDKNDVNFLFKENRAYLKLNDYSLVNETLDNLSSLSLFSSVMSRDDLLEHADNILSGIRLMTLTVKIFAILLAIIVLYNLAQLNFKERIRDISTLKVLGFGKLEIGKTLIYEIVLLTVIGSIIGLFFGMPLLKIVLGINETPLIAYIYHIDLMSYIWAVILTIGVSIVINLFITLLSDKIKMVESLKSVE